MKKPILLLLGLGLSFLSVVAQDITVFNFEDVQPAISGTPSEGFVSAVNPTKDAVNGSNNAGMYTHKAQWNDVSISIPNIDTRLYPSYEIKCYSPSSITKQVYVACFSATGAQLDWYQQSITTAGAWIKFTRNVSFGQQKIARIIVSFDRNNAYTGTTLENTVYFDDLIFKKTAVTDLTLYNENFSGGFATWEGTKTAVIPSSRNGKWFGGVNAVTPSDAPFTIINSYSLNGRSCELLLAPSATATSPGPVVTFSGVDLSGFDNLKLNIAANWPNVTAEATDFNNAGLDPALKTPKLEMQSGTGTWVTIPLTALKAEGWSNDIQTFNLSTYALGSNVTTLNYRLTSAPNLTTVFYNMTITGRIPTGISTEVANVQSLKNIFYPNPAKDFISVNSGVCQVKIFDLQGHEVLNVLNPTKIDVSKLQPGIYVLNANTKSEVINSKLVIR
jgi:hypothetical protein